MSRLSFRGVTYMCLFHRHPPLLHRPSLAVSVDMTVVSQQNRRCLPSSSWRTGYVLRRHVKRKWRSNTTEAFVRVAVSREVERRRRRRSQKQISCFHFQLVRKMDSVRTRWEKAIKVTRKEKREGTVFHCFLSPWVSCYKAPLMRYEGNRILDPNFNLSLARFSLSHSYTNSVFI
jgi:hypothetical protein